MWEILAGDVWLTVFVKFRKSVNSYSAEINLILRFNNPSMIQKRRDAAAANSSSVVGSAFFQGTRPRRWPCWWSPSRPWWCAPFGQSLTTISCSIFRLFSFKNFWKLITLNSIILNSDWHSPRAVRLYRISATNFSSQPGEVTPCPEPSRYLSAAPMTI